jgi:caffeoyl-CoA O-methyltransferase
MADIDSRTGKVYATPQIFDWLAQTHAPHDAALELAFTAPERTGLPAIQLGASEAKLLTLLVRLTGARRIVEVGTLAGYSGICLARGLPEGGMLYTIDHDEKAVDVARASFEAAGVSDRVRIVHADGPVGLASIAAEGPFDLMFVDADKARYDVYGQWATKNLRPGGMLIGDNAFFFGNLLDPDNSSAAAMRRFHEEMAASYDSVCIPTPDGMAVGILRQ